MDHSSLRASTVVLVSAKLVEKILGLAALILFARMLSVAELALIPITSLLGGLSLVVFGCGIIPTIGLEIPRLLQTSRAEADSLVGKALLVGGASALGTSAVIWSAWDHLLAWLPVLRETLLSMPWLLAAVASQCLVLVCAQLLVGQSQFRRLGYLNISMSLGRLALVPALYARYQATGIVAGLAIASAMGSVISLWWILHSCRNPWSGGYSFNRLIRLAWPFYGEGYVIYLRSQGDQLIVTAFLGVESLALYYVARRPYEMLKVIADSIDAAMTPAFSILSLEPRNAFSARWLEIYQSLAGVAFPTALLATASVPLYLSVVGEDKFAGAMIPAMLLCLAFVSDVTKALLIRGVFVLSAPLRRLQISALEALTMLLALLLATPWLGTSGVALAYLLATSFGVFIGWRALRGKVVIKGLRNIAIQAAFPSIAGFIGMASIVFSCQRMFEPAIAVTTLATAAGLLVFGLLQINLMPANLLRLTLNTTGISTLPRLQKLITFLRF